MKMDRAWADMGPEVLSPALRIPDPGTRWWVGQVVLRLRREVGWQRHLGRQDPGQAALDLLRHRAARAEFHMADPAASYLSDRIGGAEPRDGAFARLGQLAGLTDSERFVLALAIAARLETALGPIFAYCRNDASRPWPTLGLAQMLWDDPLDVLAADDPLRPLRRLGLLEQGEALSVAPTLARYLSGQTTGFGLYPVTSSPGDAPRGLAARLAHPPERLEVIALVGPATADAAGLLAALGAEGARDVVAAETSGGLPVLAWLAGKDLWPPTPFADREAVAALALPSAVAIRVYLHVTSRDALAGVTAHQLGPVVTIPAPSHKTRAALLLAAVGPARCLEDIARDFRLDRAEIARIGAAFPNPPTREDLVAACRMECSVDFQGLAEPLIPRYGRSDIVLPAAVDRQFSEAIAAIKGAARLYHDWDGARLGDGGIPLLFAGVPGTGKTMAAEVIARELDLPLFRIDLSQVVNKYIGETEKNLKRVFDAAEKMRCILFFDEAEALFGKRSEVKEANDRFANIETGYLLQRMDSFCGVSVLATNRRKDLDEAFSRRLRYIIEFPVPGAAERQRIWARVFPAKIDTSALDIGFLARRFQIAGGHIRSIALNAALQAAARGTRPHVTMRDVLIATRRELDKLNRKSGADAFGPYFAEIEELRA